MRYYDVWCNRCERYEKKKMNVQDAIDVLRSYCYKCVTGVMQVQIWKKPPPDPKPEIEG